MRKFAYFLIFIAILLIIFPFVFKDQAIFNKKEKEEEINYQYISYNDLSDNNKKIILSKLYSKSGTTESSKLKIDKQTYTLYELFSPTEVYKIEINKEKKLLTSNLDKFKNIDFYVINSNNYIIKLNFSYVNEETPIFKEKDILKKGDWIFYYDKKTLTMYGYYQLSNGSFRIKIGDGNLNDNITLQKELINLIINNINITKDDQVNELYNNSVIGYIELSKEDSIFKIDKDNIIDLGTNYYITKWSVSDKWLSNGIDIINHDYTNSLSIRESIRLYSIEAIKEVLIGNNIEEINYKEELINIINEANSNRLQGYIKNINNRSYTFLYDLNKSNILNITNNDRNMFIDYTEKNLYIDKSNNGG